MGIRKDLSPKTNYLYLPKRLTTIQKTRLFEVFIKLFKVLIIIKAMSDQPTLEYSKHQKERIANQLLEFYKDGKYMFDPDAKRQKQSHYNNP